MFSKGWSKKGFKGTNKQVPKDGKDLELRVAALYKMLGKNKVQCNVILVDEKGNRSEIDVCYGYVFGPLVLKLPSGGYLNGTLNAKTTRGMCLLRWLPSSSPCLS